MNQRHKFPGRELLGGSRRWSRCADTIAVLLLLLLLCAHGLPRFGLAYAKDVAFEQGRAFSARVVVEEVDVDGGEGARNELRVDTGPTCDDLTKRGVSVERRVSSEASCTVRGDVQRCESSSDMMKRTLTQYTTHTLHASAHTQPWRYTRTTRDAVPVALPHRHASGPW